MTTTRGARWLLGLAGCAWLAACGDDAEQAPDTNDTAGGGDSAADTIGAEATVGETTAAETTVVEIAGETGVSETTPAETTATDTAVAETTPETTPAETVTDTGVDGDTGPIEDPTPFNVKGAVKLVEQYSDGAGGVTDTYILADFSARPLEYDGVRFTKAAEDGACATWTRAENPLCDPPCAETAACVADDTCEPYATRLSAGVVTVGGTVPQGFTLAPNAIGFYVPTPDTSPDDLFTAGAALTVSAAGGDVPAFSASIEGVSDLTLTAGTGMVELVDGSPFTLTWNPSNVAGSEIEVALQLGWHGNPPTSIILCRAPDADGQLVITPKVIAEFSYFGGMGLFQVNSWMDRISRAVVPTTGGVITVTAASRRNLFVTHTAAP